MNSELSAALGHFSERRIFAAIIFSTLWPSAEDNAREVTYSEYLQILNTDNMASGNVIVKENVLVGETKRPHEIVRPNKPVFQVTKFRTILPYITENEVKTDS